MPSRLNTRSAVMNGTPGMFGSTVPDHEPQGASVLLGQLFHAVERADRDDVQARDIGKPLLQDLLNGAGAADAGDAGRQNDLFRRLLCIFFAQGRNIQPGGLEQMAHLPEIGLYDLVAQRIEVLLRRMAASGGSPQAADAAPEWG